MLSANRAIEIYEFAPPTQAPGPSVHFCSRGSCLMELPSSLVCTHYGVKNPRSSLSDTRAYASITASLQEVLWWQTCYMWSRDWSAMLPPTLSQTMKQQQGLTEPLCGHEPHEWMLQTLGLQTSGNRISIWETRFVWETKWYIIAFNEEEIIVRTHFRNLFIFHTSFLLWYILAFLPGAVLHFCCFFLHFMQTHLEIREKCL